jgi:oligoendopeptidase F
MTDSVPDRSQIDPRHTWNAESVFPTLQDWETEANALPAAIAQVRELQGTLAQGSAQTVHAFKTIENVTLRVYRVFLYAMFTFSVDSADQRAAGMAGKAQALAGQAQAAASFLSPELITIGHDTLKQWMEQDAELKIYAQYFDNLFRQQAHVRSSEVEEVLGMLSEPFSGASNVASMLTDADFKFAPANTEAGDPFEVTQGTLGKALASPDRALRQQAWQNYMDKYVEFKNTLTANLATSTQQFVFNARVRRHPDSLAYSLFEHAIPVSVYHNLLEVFKKNLPVWHRYFDIRRRALKLDKLAPYDMWAPLAPQKVNISYEKAVEMICTGLAPMGADYVETVRRGCLEERWVDIYPNKGKRNGAFSWGMPGTYPFIMMSYTDEIFSMSTLAHELGHSMHSYLTWKNQPLTYSDYSLFVAEVASNFHQALVRGHLLQTETDPNFQIALIEEAMANFFRYFFIMPTLARFELETHTRAEKGEPLTAEALIELMTNLFSEAYGADVEIDRERVGMTWATFSHLFSDFYVYQYATGISGAHALSARILRGEPGAVDDYLTFLKSGSSDYPLNVLRRAGVDLTTPEAVETTFKVMEEYINRLEKLIA